MENNNVVEDKLTKEFLTELLAKEEVSSDEKIAQILAEHNAYNRALVQKRDQLLGSEKKLKEQISSYEAKSAESDSKIKELNDLLAKANAGDKKAEEYYNTRYADAEKKFKADLEKITADRDYYKQSHLKFLRDKAIEEGTKDLNFVPGLKQGFVARVLAMNEFEPTDIDGNLKFLNKEHHTIEEAINAFALTQEGKAYIANPSTGGGARGSGGTGGFSDAKIVSRKQFENMSPSAQNEFVMKGGAITD